MRAQMGLSVSSAGLLAFLALRGSATTGPGADVAFAVDTIATGFLQPTSLVFVARDTVLLADRRRGDVSLISTSTGVATPVTGMPANLHVGDAGIHDVVLHPDFAQNQLLYVSYTVGDTLRSTLAVARARLIANRLEDTVRIFTARAWSDERYHYGGRMAIRDSLLFVTVGDRHRRERAQDLTNHSGTILRLRLDGSVPADNPFVGRGDTAPEIWTWGHRNPQGLAVNPSSGELWEHEHGPRAGDELNLIRRGANYGWPVISYGWEYDGGPIGRGVVRQDGMEQPVKVWTPTVAPSGMFFYTGTAFPAWQGSLFIGAMSGQHLARLMLEDGVVVLEQRLLLSVGRVRLVAQGPDGLIYLGTDGGSLLRLRPGPGG